MKENIEKLIASRRMENLELAINLAIGQGDEDLAWKASDAFAEEWADEMAKDNPAPASDIYGKVVAYAEDWNILPHEAIKQDGKGICDRCRNNPIYAPNTDRVDAFSYMVMGREAYQFHLPDQFQIVNLS